MSKEKVEDIEIVEESEDLDVKESFEEMSKIVDKIEEDHDKEVSKEADQIFRVEEKKAKSYSREERFEQEAREKLDRWVPKTALGKEVRVGKIKSLKEIFDSGRKIMEAEIVDLLVPNLRTEILNIGQAKGKFGGGKRRAFRQTQKKTKEGNILTFSVMAVVGDGNGHVGMGYGRAAETLPAKEKAVRKAKLNMIKILRGCASYDCSCDESHSIPQTIEGKCSSVIVRLIPAPQGTGLVVGDEIKKILMVAGVKDVYSQCLGKTRTTFNMAKACMAAIGKLGEVMI